MHVQRSIVTVTDQKLVIDLPPEYLHQRVEVLVLPLALVTPVKVLQGAEVLQDDQVDA